MQRCYETIFVLRPTLNDQAIAESIKSYGDLLQREGAEIIKQEDLGKRKLAYTIRHFQNGHYALFLYRAKPSAVNELERTFKISEDLLRFLTVRVDTQEQAERSEEAAVEASEEKAED